MCRDCCVLSTFSGIIRALVRAEKVKMHWTLGVGASSGVSSRRCLVVVHGSVGYMDFMGQVAELALLFSFHDHIFAQSSFASLQTSKLHELLLRIRHFLQSYYIWPAQTASPRSLFLVNQRNPVTNVGIHTTQGCFSFSAYNVRF